MSDRQPGDTARRAAEEKVEKFWSSTLHEKSDWCMECRADLVGLVAATIDEARQEEREACASLIEGETCAGKCDCFSCAMLNAQAAAIRNRAALSRKEAP